MSIRGSERDASRRPEREHRGFRFDVQGLRGIAVAGVVLDHAGVHTLAGGFAGVDVFFVISGFLITGQLLGRLRATGRIGFADFYLRRMRRLLPAALAVLVLTAIASVFVLPRTLLPQSLTDAASAAAYVPNLVLAARGTDYLADVSPSLYQHFWSLGVEEQFYLVWPALLALAAWGAGRAVRTARGRAAVLGGVLLLVASLSLLWELHETDASQPWAFFPMWTRAWQFALGGLAALVGPALVRAVPPAARAVVGWLGLAGIVLAYLVFDAGTVYPGVAALLPTLGAVALVAAGDTAAGPGFVLGRAPLQWLGRISYGLYLVHWPLLQLVQAHDPYGRALSRPVALGLALAAVPLAWALHRFIEQPMRYRQPRGERHPHPRAHLKAARGVAAGVLVSAVFAIVALGGASVAQAAPLHSDRVAVDRPLTAPPAATGFVPVDMHPELLAAADDNPPMYDDGCELGFAASIPHPCVFGREGLPRVVLFGDSHAAEWQPALASVGRRQGFRLVTETKSSCRTVLERQPGDAARDRACAGWRSQVLAEMRADPPAAIVLANYDGAGVGRGVDPMDAWSHGLRDTIAALPASSRIVVLADTPDLQHPATTCLAEHLDDASACAVPARQALASRGRRAIEQTVGGTRAAYVDLSRFLCASRCPVVIGRTLVYRDANHLTATFARQLAGPLDVALRPVLAPVLKKGRP